MPVQVRFIRLASARPQWSLVLRALREASGLSQDGWAARLGVASSTVQRWEAGDTLPPVRAEAALVRVGNELALFRRYEHGPLHDAVTSADSLRDLLAAARAGWHAAPNTRRGRTAARDVRGAAAPTGVPRRAGNLPLPADTFVGRERELAQVAAVLRRNRLLTLTGTGGVGKTRLALATASWMHDFDDGVWPVDLAPLRDGAQLPDLVASALGVREQPNVPLVSTLIDRLQAATVLLVFDHCDHAPRDCLVFVELLLRACPGVTVLATSRQPLGIAAEAVLRVPSLSQPGLGDGASTDALLRSDAVRLFVERARAAQPGFRLTAATAPAVEQICQQIDGIPLALELTAAQMRALDVEQIGRRLENHFDRLLGSTARPLPRQRTLRAALDWCCDLLAAPERALLRRLAVFGGSFDGESARAVCGGGLATGDVGALTKQLADAALLTVDVRDSATRYRLPAAVREYAAEKQRAAGETDVVAAAHLRWYADLAARAEPELRHADPGFWLDRLEIEHDNIRAALARSLGAGDDVTLGLRLAASLRDYWRAGGHASEGQRWIARLAAQQERASGSSILPHGHARHSAVEITERGL